MSRGMSTLVATILIVALTVLAGTVLVGIVVPFVRESLQGSTRCIAYDHTFTFNRDLPYNCIKNGSLPISISAAQTIDASAITGFQLILESKANSTIVASDSLLLLNGSLASSYPKQSETQTYVVEAASSYTTARLQTVLISGDVCPSTDILSLGPCT